MTFPYPFHTISVSRCPRFSYAAGPVGPPEITAWEECTAFDAATACHAWKKWDPQEAERAAASTRGRVACV